MYPYHSYYSQESYTYPGALEDSYNPYELNEYYVTEDPLRPQNQPQQGVFGPPQYNPQGPSQGSPVPSTQEECTLIHHQVHRMGECIINRH